MNIVATKAAKLWADKLRDGFSHDTGDAQLNSDLQGFFLAATKSSPELSLEDIDAFEKLLFERIVQELITQEEVFLETDYEPRDLLKKVVLGCPNLNEVGRFPVKSRMWVYRDRIVYSFGYGQEMQEWYP